tara:strand:- start:673 stop:1968 length:1296 start_codon:yes stop_codon:yes gene_type:complete
MKNLPCKIHVIGTEASGVEKLSDDYKEIIFSSNSICGSTRLIKSFREWWLSLNFTKPIPEVFSSNKPSELITWLKKKNGKIVFLATGDPLWYGVGRLLIEHFDKDQLFFHPAISSLQLAFSRLKVPWQTAEWTSLHGRESSFLADILKRRPKSLAILTDPSKGGPIEVKEVLRSAGLENAYQMWLLEGLGHKEERVSEIISESDLPETLNPLNLVLLLATKQKSGIHTNLPLFGIDDGIFEQHDDVPGLITKKENRVQLLAKLELPNEGIIWDIGAGGGSIGLEALRIRPKLKLLSIDKRIGTKFLIEKNSDRLGVKPKLIIEAEAIDYINANTIPKELSSPDRVIIGGGGENRIILLRTIIQKMAYGGIIVIPLITIEAISDLRDYLSGEECILDISQHQSYRGACLNDGTRLIPMNPIFILKIILPMQI